MIVKDKADAILMPRIEAITCQKSVLQLCLFFAVLPQIPPGPNPDQVFSLVISAFSGFPAMQIEASFRDHSFGCLCFCSCVGFNGVVVVYQLKCPADPCFISCTTIALMAKGLASATNACDMLQ